MSHSQQRLWDCLRTMKDPDSHQDVVSLGRVTGVELVGQNVTVQLASPNGDNFEQEALAQAIRHKLGDLEGVDRVKVVVGSGQGHDSESGSSPEGVSVHLPVLDGSGGKLPPSLAPEAGYGEGGPEVLPSPESPVTHDRYDGWPPVLQWEMDPADSSLDSGEGQVRLGDWEYDIWWQTHPSELVYVSIQALQDHPEADGAQRRHPMGRNVVVNLVWDRRREAVIAIYGTTRDFRPFIEAFTTVCDIKKRQEPNG